MADVERRDFLKTFAAAAGIPAVKSIEVLELGPGDAVVLTIPNRLSLQATDSLKKQWTEMYSGRFKAVPLIVIEEGMELKVLRGGKA